MFLHLLDIKTRKSDFFFGAKQNIKLHSKGKFENFLVLSFQQVANKYFFEMKKRGQRLESFHWS